MTDDNEIIQFAHCGLCVNEIKSGLYPGLSPRDVVRLEVGFTKEGLQIWCKRHEANVLHIDFEGHKHPAILTRKGLPGE